MLLTLNQIRLRIKNRNTKTWSKYTLSLIYYVTLIESEILGRDLTVAEIKRFQEMNYYPNGKDIDSEEEFPDWDEEVYSSHRSYMNSYMDYSFPDQKKVVIWP